jgi:hypothetical protein
MSRLTELLAKLVCLDGARAPRFGQRRDETRVLYLATTDQPSRAIWSSDV